jgi:hypothetical protein
VTDAPLQLYPGDWVIGWIASLTSDTRLGHCVTITPVDGLSTIRWKGTYQDGVHDYFQDDGLSAGGQKRITGPYVACEPMPDAEAWVIVDGSRVCSEAVSDRKRALEMLEFVARWGRCERPPAIRKVFIVEASRYRTLTGGTTSGQAVP